MSTPTADEAASTKEAEKVAAHDSSWIGLSLALLVGVVIGCLVGSLGVSMAISAVREPTSAAPVPHPNQAQAWFRDQQNERVCYTAACGKTAKELRDSINPVVPPCDYFQEYVCGRRELAYDSALGQRRYDMALHLWRKNKEFYLTSEKMPRDARHKAAYLLVHCIKRSREQQALKENVLQDFVRNEKLHLTGPPADVATGPADVLALHVHLSFKYMLGGLVHIAPSTPGCLSVGIDDSLAERGGIYKKLSSKESAIYFPRLATLINTQVTQELIKDYLELHNSVVAALMSAKTTAVASGTIRKDSTVVHTKADLVVIDGVDGQAFAEAVATKTPYPRDAAVDMDPLLPIALAAVWRAVSSDKLYLWTGWSVVDQLAPYADVWFANRVGEDNFFLGCVDRIRRSFGVPFAAISLHLSQALRNGVSATVRSVLECLSKNAIRWLQPSVASRKGVKVIVGFPPEEDTLEKQNARYASYLGVIHNEFLPDWFEVMKTRKQLLNISHVHFDPSDVDVVVSGDGLVVVPAGAVFYSYRDGDLPVINLGRLGQMVGTRFVQRFRLPSVPPKPECLAPADSKAGNVFEALLALQCTQNLFNGSVDPKANGTVLLPMHPNMTSAKQLFVAACFQSCYKWKHGVEANCETGALRRLPTFADAFACQRKEPACKLP